MSDQEKASVEAPKKTPFILMEEYVNRNYKFIYNVVCNRVIKQDIKSGECSYLDDCTFNTLLVDLWHRKISITKATLSSYLYSNYSEQFDPFQSYFENLAQWTPEMPDYIQELADTVTVPEGNKDLWNEYLKRWLIATVGCAINPKITNQQVLVFIGDQGIGKTKWTEKLMPEKLKEYYYSGNVNPGDKDSSVNLAECFIINLDELGNLNRGDLNTLKQLITQSSIRIRRPYTGLPTYMPRRASFVGSVNNSEFLRDDTGNRRYLCVECQSINYKNEINMDLVYAQAYYLLQNGTKYWFEGEEVENINELNKQYRVHYEELEYVNEFFEPCSRDDKDAIEMTLTQVQQFLKEKEKHIFNISNRMLGIAMKASDYISVKKNGGTKYYKLKLKKTMQTSK